MQTKTFRTLVPLQKPTFEIGYDTPTLMIGSCFSENIGKRCQDLRLPILVNPLGILFNPVSIAQALRYVIERKIFEEKDLFQQNGLWHSFAHHGRFSGVKKEEVLENINAEIQNAHLFFQKCSRLVITLGTANIYEYKKTGKIVANCHKVPNHEFEKKRLTVDEIVKEYQALFALLPSHIEVILTVSPIRHLRDGFIENQRSKATLLLAIDALLGKRVHYFPAYELLLDDLRDYRFYTTDMLHPTDVAIDYIFHYFQQTYCSPATISLLQEVQALNNSLAHRPLHGETEDFLRFKAQIAEKEKKLIEKISSFNNVLTRLVRI